MIGRWADLPTNSQPIPANFLIVLSSQLGSILSTGAPRVSGVDDCFEADGVLSSAPPVGALGDVLARGFLARLLPESKASAIVLR